jgi:hypothetical protein
MTTALEGDERSASRPGRYLPPRKNPVPIVQKAWWTPGPVWTGAENLAPNGIRYPNRPVRSSVAIPHYATLPTDIYVQPKIMLLLHYQMPGLL